MRKSSNRISLPNKQSEETSPEATTTKKEVRSERKSRNASLASSETTETTHSRRFMRKSVVVDTDGGNETEKGANEETSKTTPKQKKFGGKHQLEADKLDADVSTQNDQQNDSAGKSLYL